MTLQDIGEHDHDHALLCVTDLRNCCRPPHTGKIRALGSWYFPNGTRVPSSGIMWDFYRTRGPSVVRLRRRRGGENGIYRCVIPDTANVFQTIYIGVYTAITGEPPLTN